MVYKVLYDTFQEYHRKVEFVIFIIKLLRHFLFLCFPFLAEYKTGYPQNYCEQGGGGDTDIELGTNFWTCVWVTRWSKINRNFCNYILVIPRNSVMVLSFFLQAV